ncbi:MAG: FKBP-type peptidyl-prolyl cis-trans isomerase [Tenuifilaceae bacterium]
MRYWINFYASLLLLFIFSFGHTSCKKSLEDEKAYAEDKVIESYINKKGWKYTKVDGVYHVSRVPSYNYQVAEGDSVSFLFKGYTLGGFVFETNIKSEAIIAKLDTVTRTFEPISTVVGNEDLIKGVDIGLLQVNLGEEATLLFPSPLGFGNNAIGPIGHWTTLAYDIKVLSISNSKISQEKNYITSLNLENSGYSKDISGLYFKYLILGAGSSPTLNDTIYGWYKRTLADGTLVEDLRNDNPEIVLSKSEIPIGVRLGFTLAKEGGSSDLVVVSYLGYGINGNSVVEPYQTLFYQIRLDSIKKPL